MKIIHSNPAQRKEPQNVTGHAKRRHDQQKTKNKTTDKMPTLRKIKRAAMPLTSRHKMQHILFCPTHLSPPATLTNGRLDF